ncbi:MAG: hypothetical protein B7Y80_20145 [Hyphomicrobium sp. 32-62-53]|nr:MAG: hypothetical protein B7Z29_19975 [Hyphomicrobium sp. 12-62-95]OYX97345.1 MAG: hypothetical protein B7Y80_20145 [Hyphomicrobium sp. 32-62-53]
MTSMIEASAEAPTVAALAAEWERRVALIDDEAVSNDEVPEHADHMWAAFDRLRVTPSASLKDVVRKHEIIARLQSRGYEDEALELVDSAFHDLRRLSAG